jgi:hypothetical protein
MGLFRKQPARPDARGWFEESMFRKFGPGPRKTLRKG